MILDPEVQLWNEKLKCLRKNEKKQTITISIAAGNYRTEIVIDLINQTNQNFLAKYQESRVGFENFAYLQSIENKCKHRRMQSSLLLSSQQNISHKLNTLKAFYNGLSVLFDSPGARTQNVVRFRS